MDEAVTLEAIGGVDARDDDDSRGAIRRGPGLRRRVRGVVERGRELASISTLARLTALYFAQTGLIFPGRRTQGQPRANVTPTGGAALVKLRTACGEIVSAMFGPATDDRGNPLPDYGSRPTILFFYGNGHYLGAVRHLFDGLRRLGANVLIPEYIGYGLSTGDASERGCYATADAAYAYLRTRNDLDQSKVIVAGASLGGAVAIDLASREQVAGLFTLITFSSMTDMARVVRPGSPIWRFIRHRFDSVEKMPAVTCPTLIIHSTGDALVPYAMSDRLAAACGGQVSRLRIEGAGHSSVEMLQGGGGAIYQALMKFLKAVC